MKRPLPLLVLEDESSPTTNPGLLPAADTISPIHRDSEQIDVGFELHLTSGTFNLDGSSSDDFEVLEELHLCLSGGRGVRKILHKERIRP